MRKILISLLIVLLLVVVYLMGFNGLNLLGTEVLSIFQIKDKSDMLDLKLQEVSTLTSVDQPKTLASLNDSAKQLRITKEEYNDIILNSTPEEIEQATHGIKYEMDFIWTKVGNHATKNGITLRLVTKPNSSGVDSKYDLEFTATGAYTSISEFVESLENDSSLNFQIENFRIQRYNGSTDVLQADFKVKNLGIDINESLQSGNTQSGSTNSNNTQSNSTNDTSSGQTESNS